MSNIKIEGIFKDWEFGFSSITSPGRKYSLWIKGGFSEFENDDTQSREDFMDGATKRDRRILWKEYKAERRRRSMKDGAETRGRFLDRVNEFMP